MESVWFHFWRCPLLSVDCFLKLCLSGTPSENSQADWDLGDRMARGYRFDTKWVCPMGSYAWRIQVFYSRNGAPLNFLNRILEYKFNWILKSVVKSVRFLPFAKNLHKNLSKTLQWYIESKSPWSCSIIFYWCVWNYLKRPKKATVDLIGNKVADIYKCCNIIASIASRSNPDIASQIKNQYKYQKQNIYHQKEDNRLLMKLYINIYYFSKIMMIIFYKLTNRH